MSKSIDYADACDIIRSYVPIIRTLNDADVDYCMVGGLAVLAHAVNENVDRFRLTQDADIMLADEPTNTDFISLYLSAYSCDQDDARTLRDAAETAALQGCDFDNMTIKGIPSTSDDDKSPNLDIVRTLNGKTLSTLGTTEIEFEGVTIKVADIDTLLEMKRSTIDLLHAPFEESSRPQDFIDVMTLEQIKAAHESKEPPNPRRQNLANRVAAKLGSRPEKHDDDGFQL